MTRALAIGLVLLVACGDGGSEKRNPPPAAAGGAKPGAKPKPKGKVSGLRIPVKVEDRVTESERATIRHTFREADFKPDPTGADNRDPFRSYVIAQVGGTLSDNATAAQPPTPQCKTQKQMVATNYGLRDLRLVGIVSRGVKKFALFQDSKDYGHIVYRNDCLGREKALVKDIGAGFVTLSIQAEAQPNQAQRPPEERSIPLYPEELKLGESDRERGDLPPPVVTPPAMPPSDTPGGPAPEPVLPPSTP